MIVPVVCMTLAFLYGVLLVLYRLGWQWQRTFHVPAGFEPQTSISIVIPARNEAQRIGDCLEAICAQRYPAHLLEVIVADDFSEDGTAERVRSFDGRLPLKIVRLQDVIGDRAGIVAYKKTALEAGIARSTGELIVTTDADCTAGPGWLLHLAAAYETSHPAMLIAPVDFKSGPGVVSLFQSLDFMTMQGITAAAQRLELGNMANGANLAFSSAAYKAVNGYEGTKHLASGDDYLLLVKMKERYPDGIRYVRSREAIVRTPPQPDWASFLQQRTRWASKSGKYKDHRLTVLLLLVFCFNCSLPLLFIAGLFHPPLLLLLVFILAWKTALELLLLLPVARFFGKTRQLLLFPLLQPLHIAYICLAGFLGWKGGFEWKGRRVK